MKQIWSWDCTRIKSCWRKQIHQHQVYVVQNSEISKPYYGHYNRDTMPTTVFGSDVLWSFSVKAKAGPVCLKQHNRLWKHRSCEGFTRSIDLLRDITRSIVLMKHDSRWIVCSSALRRYIIIKHLERILVYYSIQYLN